MAPTGNDDHHHRQALGHLSTLGLSPGADAAQVRRAYCRLAMSLHPDKTGNDAAKTRRFQQVADAYQALLSLPRQHHQDDGTAESVAGAPSVSTRLHEEDEDDDVVGSDPPPDVVTLDVSLHDLRWGGRRVLTYSVDDACPSCHPHFAHNNNGHHHACSHQQRPVTVLCMSCVGSGRLAHGPCHLCDGTGFACLEGFAALPECVACGGRRLLRATRRIALTLAPGVPDGHRYLLSERGSYAACLGRHRDLVVAVRHVLQAPIERCDGETGDVHVRARVPLRDLVLGYEMSVPDLTSQKSSSSGQQRWVRVLGFRDPTHPFALEGMGVPPYRGSSDGPFGKLIVHVDVVWPAAAEVDAILKPALLDARGASEAE
jgi:DnaJ-class molecular chaperone